MLIIIYFSRLNKRPFECTKMLLERMLVVPVLESELITSSGMKFYYEQTTTIVMEYIILQRRFVLKVMSYQLIP